MEWFPSINLPYCWTFEYLHRELYATESFYVLRHDTNIVKYRRIFTMEKAMLCTIKEYPSERWGTFELAFDVSQFLTQTHTWNACRQISHCYNEAFWTKSLRGMTIQAEKCIHPSNSMRLLLSQHCISHIAMWNLLTTISSICRYISVT